MNNKRPYLVVKEVAEILHLSTITIRRYIKNKKIEGFYKIGREWRVDSDKIDLFIKNIKKTGYEK